MTITANMTLVVVWVICSELARRTEPLDVVYLGAMLIALHMHHFAVSVNAHNTARYRSPIWELIAIIAALQR